MSQFNQVYRPRRPMSRRTILRGMAGVGAAAAFGPTLAACAAGAASPNPTAPPAATPGPTGVPTTEPTAEPTPVPTPESELYIYNWADYIGEDTISKFQDQTGIKVTYDFFDSAETQGAKIATGNSGYDVTFPTSTYIKGYLDRDLILPLDLSLLPNAVNLGAEWQNPGYDPGNQHSMPYMWWTTGVAYDTAKIKGELTSYKALWDEQWSGKMAMLDDMRETFAAALIILGYSANTTSDAELDEALALLQKQQPLLRTYTTDDIGVLSTGDVWLMQAWGADVYQVQEERDTVTYYIPEEGGVRGSDTMVLLAGAQHPIAAHTFINFMLDAEVAAGNTNYIGYMGPNEAAKQYIDPGILEDPTVNPDAALVAKLQEILDLGADEQKYSDRWTTLRAGG
ncbi:MAG: extracellular solute-binding protein [Chloroflexi bacterium]|nr:extracellular solute-binding protein [Chloroflexota bacterium]